MRHYTYYVFEYNSWVLGGDKNSFKYGSFHFPLYHDILRSCPLKPIQCPSVFCSHLQHVLPPLYKGHEACQPEPTYTYQDYYQQKKPQVMAMQLRSFLLGVLLLIGFAFTNSKADIRAPPTHFDTASLNRSSFPEGFIFGVGSGSYQVSPFFF